jgi:hypothetical protein
MKQPVASPRPGYDAAVDWLKHHESVVAWIGTIAIVVVLATSFHKPPSPVARRRVTIIALFLVFAGEAMIALSASPSAAIRFLASVTAFLSLSACLIEWFENK